jgi:type II secretory pathway pseudopilin PulG
MDFQDATARLARDQSKMRIRHGGFVLSEKATKQAEFQRKQQARLRAERERLRQIERYQRQFMHQNERTLKKKSIGPAGSHLLLQPTSIHGDGDKIALPPSVLSTLTFLSAGDDMMNEGNPWTFRIGILNPEYSFPASPLIQNLTPQKDNDELCRGESMQEQDDFHHGSDDEEQVSYLDELSHKYLVYTHCTVVEFTQEEGNVGIPRHIATALLDPKNRHHDLRHLEIKKTKTVDPAAKSIADTTHQDDQKNITIYDQPNMKQENSTPGHLAWGAFDIPAEQLEITMVRLPQGRGCTLIPTQEALRNNFYGLRDVKLVLEQSLIRTRATLSTGDVVSTWHRGVQFDLNVSKVLPPTFHAITCINTDIEVNIEETQTDVTKQEHRKQNQTSKTAAYSGDESNSGPLLGKSHTISSFTVPSPVSSMVTSGTMLIPEPPVDQNDGVCTVQIRYSGGQMQRRFSINAAQGKDLFAFAASIINQRDDAFQLVTRFPRRELKLANVGHKTLAELGLQRGRELFLVENL